MVISMLDLIALCRLEATSWREALPIWTPLLSQCLAYHHPVLVFYQIHRVQGLHHLRHLQVTTKHQVQLQELQLQLLLRLTIPLMGVAVSRHL